MMPSAKNALKNVQALSLAGIIFFAPTSVAGMNIMGGGFVILSAIILGLSKEIQKKFDKKSLITIIFALWVAISAFWAPSWADSWPSLKSLWWYAILPLSSLTIEWSERKFKLLVYALIFGNITNAIIFMVQYSHLINGFEYNAKYGLVGFGNRVYLAMLVPPTIIILINDARRRFYFKNPYTSIIFACALIFELGWSTGRTAQLMLIILALFFYRNALIKHKLLTIGAATLTVIFIALSPYIIHRWFEAYQNLVLYQSGNASTDFGLRFAFWEAAIKMFVSHPFLGVGAGGYTPHFFTLMKNHEIPKIDAIWYWAIEPHNTYLAILAEYGLIGFALFYAIISIFYNDSKIIANTPIGEFKFIILVTFLIASFSDTFIWRWQGMMILLVAFSIKNPIRSTSN